MIFFEFLIIFILGLVVGSFSNVCVYRIPRRQSIVFPASNCPNCKKNIPPYYNIPIFSFLYLGAKCKFCLNSISFIYPVIELLMALLFILFYFLYGTSTTLILFFILIPTFVIIFAIDFKHYIIPDSLVGIIGLVGIIKFFFYEIDIIFSGLIDSVYGSLIALTIIGGLISFYYYIRKIEAMGLGDLKLFFVIGFLFGVKGILFILICSSIIGALIGSLILLIKKESIKTQLPFGPYIIFSTFFYCIFGLSIVEIIKF